MNEGNKKRIIVVLGMHRSGTSAIARGLEALGVELGDHLLPSVEGDNDKGYWEDIDINEINNDLLSHLGHHWSSLLPITPGQLDDDLAPFRLRAIDLLRAKSGQAAIPGIKNPRIARLLPFWKSIFEDLDLDVGYVIAVRNPLSVARSLAKNNLRGDIPPGKAYYLWLVHAVSSMVESEGKPRVVVDYDRLMDQPGKQLQRIAETLNLPFNDTTEIDEYARQFLQADLRHTRFQIEDLRSAPEIPPEVIEAYSLLDRLAKDQVSGSSAEVHAVFARLNKRLEELRPAFEYMAQRDEQISSLRAELEAKNQQLSVVFASTSWRLTSPYRRVGHRIKRIGQILERFFSLGKQTPVFPKPALSEFKGKDAQTAACNPAPEASPALEERADTVTGGGARENESPSPVSLVAGRLDGRNFHDRIDALVPTVRYAEPWNLSLPERLRLLAVGRTRVAYFYEKADSSTFRYRAYNMAQALNADGRDVTASYFFRDDLPRVDEIADRADVLVICRTRYDDQINRLVAAFRQHRKRVLFDIDDFVFDTAQVPLIMTTLDQNPEDPKLWDYWYACISRIGATLKLCDGAITTNEFLAERIREFADVPVSIVPNFLNSEQLEISDRVYAARQSLKPGGNGLIHLGYFSGSPSHNRDFEIVVPALEALLEKDSRLGLMLVGCIEPGPALERFGSRVKRFPIQDFLNLQRLIGSVAFNLMPLQLNVFTNCKSELKYFEAAIVGTPSIASPGHMYAKSIRHGDNGYLSQAHQWEETIRQAVNEIGNYHGMAARCYEDARAKYAWFNQKERIVSALGLA